MEPSKLDQPRSWRIRSAGAADVAALAQLHVDTFVEAHGDPNAPNYSLREAQWSKAFTDPDSGFVYVAETTGGTLIGFARGVRHDGGVPGYGGELDKIYVRRAWHRYGVGRALVAAVAATFRSMGITSMLLFGDARNPSNGFYEHLGAERLFSPEGQFHGGYGWRDLTLFQGEPIPHGTRTGQHRGAAS